MVRRLARPLLSCQGEKPATINLRCCSQPLSAASATARKGPTVNACPAPVYCRSTRDNPTRIITLGGNRWPLETESEPHGPVVGSRQLDGEPGFAAFISPKSVIRQLALL